jgi:hypothetical protein
MRQLLVLVAFALAPLATARASCVDGHNKWPTDFSVFMALMDCASAEFKGTPARATSARATYLDRLSGSLTGKEVQWSGTVRLFRKNQVYFNESFAYVEPGMTAARGMYYVAPEQITKWQRVPVGTLVRYSGRIKATQVDALSAPKPLLFVEVEEVRLTTE